MAGGSSGALRAGAIQRSAIAACHGRVNHSDKESIHVQRFFGCAELNRIELHDEYRFRDCHYSPLAFPWLSILELNGIELYDELNWAKGH